MLRHDSLACSSFLQLIFRRLKIKTQEHAFSRQTRQTQTSAVVTPKTVIDSFSCTIRAPRNGKPTKASCLLRLAVKFHEIRTPFVYLLSIRTVCLHSLPTSTTSNYEHLETFSDTTISNTLLLLSEQRHEQLEYDHAETIANSLTRQALKCFFAFCNQKFMDFSASRSFL